MAEGSTNSPERAANLGFSFHLVGGDGKLSLREQRFFEWLLVDRLELEVPSLPLPVDLADGPRHFQRRRTRVTLATFRMDQSDIDRFVASRAAALAEHGIDELRIRASGGYLAVSGRARDGRHAAELTGRIYVRGRGAKLELIAADTYIYGFLGTSGPVLAHNILVALVGDAAEQRALGILEVAPLTTFLWNALPAAGWRLPDSSQIELIAARATRGALEVTYARPATIGRLSGAARGSSELQLPEAADYLEAIKRFRDGDEYLIRRDVDSALRAYRAELDARGPDQPHLVARILAIASAHPAWFRDAEDLAREALGRWPEFVPALRARAAVAVGEGHHRDAAEWFDRMAVAASSAGDDEATARAALAGARLLRATDSARATALYERVLEHRPGHAEAVEALLDHYEQDERWQDLVRLLRMRIAATTDRDRQARDHVRLALVLRDSLGDAARARDELERATQLAADHVAAWEALADTLFVLDDRTLAISALDTAAELYRARDDADGEARAHVAAAEAWQQSDDTERAAKRLQRALELCPDYAPALEGAARLATADGEFERAAGLWQRRLRAGGLDATSRSAAQCELAHCLIQAGRGDDARPALHEAAGTHVGEASAEAWAMLAELDREQGSHDGAADAYSMAVAELIGDRGDPSTVAPARRVRAAQLALARAELVRSEADFELAHELDPLGATGRAAARALYARAAEAGDAERCRRWIDALVHDGMPAPDEIDARLARADLEASADDPAAAASDVARLRETDLQDAMTPEQRGRMLALEAELAGASGDSIGRARALCLRAEGLAQSEDGGALADAITDCADAWLDAGDTVEALAAARRAAVYLAEAGDIDDADEARRRRVHRVLGAAAWRRRAWADVTRAYAALCADAATSSRDRALYGQRLGMALDKQGQLDGAIDALEHVTAEPEAQGDELATSWRVLAGLYERRGDSLAAASAFEAFAGDTRTAAPNAMVADAWYRAGELYRKQSGGVHASDAERCLEAALRLTPDHMPALDALERLKGAAEDWERVAVILSRKLAATQRQPGRQKALLVRLAELQAERLERGDVALETYRRALSIDPELRPALRYVAAHTRDSAPDEAVDAYRKLSGMLAGDDEIDPGDEPALLAERKHAALELVSLLLELGRPADAVEPLRAALERAPDDAALLEALCDALRAAAMWPEAAEALGRLAAATDDRSVALQSDLQRIAIFGSHIQDTGAAWAACRAALARSPDDPALLATAIAIARGAGEPAEQVDVFVAAAESERACQLAGTSTADLLTEAADLCAGPLGDRTRAAALYVRALDRDPSHSVARARISELPGEPLGADEVASAYEAVPEVIAQETSDAIDAARALFDDGDLDGALDLLLPAEPRTAPISLLSLRTELFEACERWREAADDLQVLRVRAAAAGDTANEHQTTRRLAALTLEHLHDHAGAASLYERALAIDPDDLAAAEALAGIYGRQRDRTAQLDALEQVLAIARRTSAAPARQAEILRELARAARTDRQLDRAARYLDEARAVAPHDLQVLRARAELAAGAGDYATCADCLETLAARLPHTAGDSDASPAGSAGDVLLELAGVYTDKMQEPERGRRAISRAAQAFGDTPRGDAARRMLATQALGEQDEEEVVAALSAIAPERRTQADLVNLAKALKRRGHDRRAITVLEEARRREPLPDEAAMLLFALHRELERKAQLAQSLERGAYEHPPEVARTRLREALLIYEQSLDDRDNAARVRARLEDYAPTIQPASPAEEPALEVAPPAEEPAHEAAPELAADTSESDLDDLARALAQSPADAELFARLRAAARDVGDFSQLAAAYELHIDALEGAARIEPLGELERLWRFVLDDEDRADECARAAQELAAAAEAPPAATDEAPPAATDEAPPAATDETPPAADSEDIEARLHRAREFETRGQQVAAISQYETASAAAPDDPRPLQALERLYRLRGDNDALSEILGRQIVVAQSNRERAQVWYRRGKLYRDVLHREPETYRCLKEAYANDPNNRDIAYALRSVAMARGEWALAAELVYREIDAAPSTAESAALHLELALIYDEKLLDANQARINYEQALALDADIPAAPAPLARLYELAGRHDEAARAAELAARHARDDDTRSTLLRRAAACAERAGKKDEARRLYGLGAMFAADAADSNAAQASVARLSTDPGDRTTRMELLEMRLGESGDPEEQQDLRHQLLDLAVAAGETGAIRRHAGALLEEDAGDLSAFLALKRAATAVGDWAILAYLLRTRAGAVDDRVERAALFYELGRLCTNRLSDIGGAIAAFEQALVADARHPAALEALADIAFEKHDWERARDLYARLRPESCSLPADVLAYRRGEICEALGHLDEAAGAYAESCKVCPSNRMALAALARTALQLGDLSTSIDASRAMVDFMPPDDVAALDAARLQVAELCRRADDAETAVHYYEAVLQEEPSSLAALVPLAELYPRLERWQEQATTLTALAGLADTESERAELEFQRAEVYQERIGDADKAAECYLRAVDLAPTHVPTLRRLIDYYFRVNDVNSAMEIIGELVEQQALLSADTHADTLARALLLAVAAGDTSLALRVGERLGDTDALAAAMIEAANRDESAIPDLVETAHVLSRAAPNLSLQSLAAATERADPDHPLTRALTQALPPA